MIFIMKSLFIKAGASKRKNVKIYLKVVKNVPKIWINACNVQRDFILMIKINANYAPNIPIIVRSATRKDVPNAKKVIQFLLVDAKNAKCNFSAETKSYS